MKLAQLFEQVINGWTLVKCLNADQLAAVKVGALSSSGAYDTPSYGPAIVCTRPVNDRGGGPDDKRTVLLQQIHWGARDKIIVNTLGYGESGTFPDTEEGYDQAYAFLLAYLKAN